MNKKVFPDDKGSVTSAIYVKGDQVVISYAEELTWVSLGKVEVLQLIKILQEKVKQLP